MLVKVEYKKQRDLLIARTELMRLVFIANKGGRAYRCFNVVHFNYEFFGNLESTERIL